MMCFDTNTYSLAKVDRHLCSEVLPLTHGDRGSAVTIKNMYSVPRLRPDNGQSGRATKMVAKRMDMSGIEPDPSRRPHAKRA